MTIPKDSSKPSQPSDALAQKDARLALLISFTAFIMFAMLLWDRPFPSPDFYSFAQAAQDIVLARPTESKYPPGLSLLLIPFIPLGINAQVIAAQVIGVISALGFAWSLFALCRHLNIPAGSPCIALTLFNRYTIQSAMSGTAHTPFLFLSTSALISAAHKRWALAYILASASTLFRYNGVLLPLLVGAWHFTTLKRKGNELPMRQFAIPAVCVALCLVPSALWITLGTTSALGMYAEEVAMRGTAGIKALIYLPATMMTSFLDPSASQALRSAPAEQQLLTALTLLGPFFLGMRGIFALSRHSKGISFWLLSTLVLWVIVHARFPEVGGLFFYAIQVTWIFWLAIFYGFWGNPTKLSYFALSLPLLLLLKNENVSLVTVALVVLALLIIESPYRKKVHGGQILFSVIIASACVIGSITAKTTIHDSNYQPLIPTFIQWTERHPKVLISYPLWMQLHTHGWDTSSLIPENLVDGDHLEKSLQDLRIRYVAVGNWEVKNRLSQEFWQGHEFFLGKHYKTSLRPYQLIVQAYEERGFAYVQDFSFRSTQIKLFRPLYEKDSANSGDAKR